MRYLFEEYAFDTERRELHRGTDAVSITPQVFDLLDYLIRNREQVVSKDDLINAIWNGRSVSDAALTTRLNAARSALGDTGEQQRLIKTLPRKGFRFIGTVREANGDLGTRGILDGPVEEPGAGLPLPDRPSIAVLPFVNLSSEPDQEYFADGMVEEIITALSRFKTLFVIARNSSFTYREGATNLKQVGRELGVRYILEGSVRKSVNRLRIAGQLIDTATGVHIWADRFDATLQDVFDLQDKLSTMIVGAISPKVEQAEIERARRKPTENLRAYDYYLRGLASFHRGSKKSLREALALFKRAIQLDPSFALASAMAAWCYVVPHPGLADSEDAREAERLARLAARLGADDATALCVAGFVLAEIAGEVEMGADLASRALVLNPNLVTAWFLGGWVQVINGQSDAAIERFAQAERLSPFDPFLFGVRAGIAQAHFNAGRDEQALFAAELCLRDKPNYPPALLVVAASSALIGAGDRARAATARIRAISPKICITEMERWLSRRPSEYIARMIHGLREAGLPQ
ncbi:winged helix-turn-helix domain-containing tetratricopeptide repeat protein [Bradyrhizobium sp. CCBAU 53415]|uniref:winged helix-turn-helix domain-containing tetratricopeptide repeat protein n=1 Tax=Bradyrhizobium sp. CCBAU 53415 TaxID=1325119 RepID=UPI00230586CD|nr:winged helix-turn-helix domain-containing tetratricopeptide repeat protein [Bradyrhizobium sp. CCBAU 53415]MDA9468199.1 CadC-family transcriptional regulator [Bradyrhizobium sp. CCBAU 53415]